jgi:epoxide hydrolase 4
MIRISQIAANGLEFDTLLAGAPDAPLILFLHGFPEYAGAWTDILPHFADQYLAVAPNQRGYATSSKPQGIENYRAQHLAKDMLDLAARLSPDKKFHLVAHDWGASVAYLMSFLAPHRIASFTAINGVHPVPFQRALIDDEAQRAASQYIRFLRRDDAADLLSENDFKRTFDVLARGFGAGEWLTDQKREGYRNAWSQPGAMEGMVSWYKATPLIVAEPGQPAANPLTKLDPAKVHVAMPHQVIWGLNDKALLPSSRGGLAAHCANLSIHDIPDADHWVIHQHPGQVCTLIRRFIDHHATSEHAHP